MKFKYQRDSLRFDMRQMSASEDVMVLNCDLRERNCSDRWELEQKVLVVKYYVKE